jgi:trans-aconitate methyltransferase
MESTIEARPNVRNNYRSELGETFNYFLKNEVKNQPNRILSVGCMFGYEAGALLNVFPTAEYIGIDIDENYIRAAKAINNDLSKAEFHFGDARKKETFGENPWDIIVIRHPQILGTIIKESNLAKDWQVIFKNSMSSLKPGGSMFISTSSKQERDRVIKYINSSEDKMIITVNSENEFSKSIGTFQDDFVIISQKLINK